MAGHRQYAQPDQGNLADNHLFNLAALTTDIKAVLRINNFHTLKVEIFNLSVGILGNIHKNIY